MGEVKSGGTANKFQYTGQERDAETNLHYYNARYYDPHIRRFTQPDDIIQNVYNPQDLNRYSYVRNNPLKYTDPTGHFGLISRLIDIATSYFMPKQSTKPAPKPASTAKLPDNKNLQSTKVNLSNKSGNVTNVAPDHTIQTHLAKVWNNGSVNVSAGGSIGPFGGSVGATLNKHGYTPTGGGNVGFGLKFGGTVILSEKPIKQDSIDFDVTLSIIGAVKVGYDPLDPYNYKKWAFEGWGGGCCGIETGPEYTGLTTPWSDPRIEHRSKPIDQVYV